MNKKQKIGFCIFIVFLILIGALGLYKSTQKMTYIEYEEYGKVGSEALNMCDNHYLIEQEFKIPYKMFHGISLRIGNYGRENNSRYELIVKDKTLDKIIAVEEFNTSKVKDKNYYEIFFNSPIEVDGTHDFSVIIKAKTLVNAENGVAFYIDNTDTPNSGNLYYNGTLYEANLCMNVYGGNTNTFWFVFTLICEIYLIALLAYTVCLWLHKKTIKSNTIVQVGFLGIVIFSMLVTFLKIETFSDEVDNIIGGILVGKGYTLYVDYYTGHTPFAYWLCAAFSVLGPISLEQFRLLYYVLISVIYMGLFIRHKNNFGSIKMALIPIIQIAFGILMTTQTVMILSDNIQTICMIALLLEFLQYLKDEKLDWKRAIIVSISIFCSFGSAFVSAYAIFAICLGVFIKEITYWKKEKFSFVNAIKRYWKLVVACAIPFVITLIYFMVTNSIFNVYEQAFKFNTEVYSEYLEDGLRF